MNYEKIYNELIEHRKMLPKHETSYYERHHIVPKSLGGNDNDENLIYLTYSDHYMAHILLAKIYGGSMWYAAKMMQSMSGGKLVNKRRIFEIVKRNTSIAMSDVEVREYYNTKTGELFLATRLELKQLYNISSEEVTCLLNGTIKCAKFITLSESFYNGTITERWKRYDVVEIKTGKTLKLTRSELRRIVDCTAPGVDSFVKGKIKNLGGYKLKDTVLDSEGRTKRNRKSHWLKNIHTNVIVLVCSKTVVSLCGITVDNFYALTNRKNKRAGNFEYICREDEKHPLLENATYLSQFPQVQ